MGLLDKIKDISDKISENLQDRREYINARKSLLSELTMPQLINLAKDYDISIYTFFEEEPTREDYIDSIAKSNLSTDLIQKRINKINRKDEIELGGPEPKNVSYVIQGNVNNSQFSLGGDVNILHNTFNDWSKTIMNSDIDFDLKKMAVQNIKQLREEMDKPKKDQTKINKIFKWFTDNKAELVSLSIPFIEKILSCL